MFEDNDSGIESSVESETNDLNELVDTVEVSDEDIQTAYDTLEPKSTSISTGKVEKSDESLESAKTVSSEKNISSMISDAKSKQDLGYDTLTEKEQQMLATPSKDRNWHETEVADSIRHTKYATQLSFTKDADGNIVEAAHGEKGSQRPDGIRIDEQGRIDIREVKDYHNKNALMRNMAEQAADRYAFFGDETELTFAIAANDFTMEDAIELQDYVENTLHANIEWINK